MGADITFEIRIGKENKKCHIRDGYNFVNLAMCLPGFDYRQFEENRGGAFRRLAGITDEQIEQAVNEERIPEAAKIAFKVFDDAIADDTEHKTCIGGYDLTKEQRIEAIKATRQKMQVVIDGIDGGVKLKNFCISY